MSRANQKMIGIYVSEGLHRSIKKAAQDRGMTVKEYLISLHRRETEDPSVEILEDIRKKTDLILDLVGGLSYTPISRKAISATPKDDNIPNEGANEEAKLSQSLMEYLEQFQSVPRQYRALKETLEIIVRHGGSATSVQIKEGRGFSRTTLVKGQVERLEKDGIVTVDYSRKPFIVALVESYR